MEEKIARARALAEALNSVPGIERAWVDDWNKHGSFSLFASIPGRGRFECKPADAGYDLRRVVPKLKRALQGQSYSITCPKRVYDKVRSGFGYKLRFVGYENNLISIDLNL